MTHLSSVSSRLLFYRLLYVTGLGIYISSYAKDLACTPRPYSPPVIRLCEYPLFAPKLEDVLTISFALTAMSTHGQEYGKRLCRGWYVSVYCLFRLCSIRHSRFPLVAFYQLCVHRTVPREPVGSSTGQQCNLANGGVHGMDR